MRNLLAKNLIRDIQDFPKLGIVFKDITPVLQDPAAFQEVIDCFTEFASERQPDVIVGIESRGFVFGAPVALSMARPFVFVRKVGKLPHTTISKEYALEYGTSALEMHLDSVSAGQRVLIIDDLLATGGTAKAAAGLIEQLGGRVVGYSFLIELSFLSGREQLGGDDVQALITY